MAAPTLSSSAGLEASYNPRTVSSGWTYARDVVTYGASGAPTDSADHPSISTTRNSTGNYALKYPPCADFDLDFCIISATQAVSNVVITALNTTAGTATIVTTNAAGTATDPASGDVIHLNLSLRHKE